MKRRRPAPRVPPRPTIRALAAASALAAALLVGKGLPRRPSPATPSLEAPLAARPAPRLTAAGLRHILDGDGAGGGHGPGRGFPGKSEFPRSWSDETVRAAVLDVASDPRSFVRLQPNGRYKIRGVREGIDIRVILASDGTVLTAYPANVPSNP